MGPLGGLINSGLIESWDGTMNWCNSLRSFMKWILVCHAFFVGGITYATAVWSQTDELKINSDRMFFLYRWIKLWWTLLSQALQNNKHDHTQCSLLSRRKLWVLQVRWCTRLVWCWAETTKDCRIWNSRRTTEIVRWIATCQVCRRWQCLYECTQACTFCV